jgi:hypothetical protein
MYAYTSGQENASVSVTKPFAMGESKGVLAEYISLVFFMPVIVFLAHVKAELSTHLGCLLLFRYTPSICKKNKWNFSTRYKRQPILFWNYGIMYGISYFPDALSPFRSLKAL